MFKSLGLEISVPCPLWVTFDDINRQDGVGCEKSECDEKDSKEQDCPMGRLEILASISEEKTPSDAEYQWKDHVDEMTFWFSATTVAAGKSIRHLVCEEASEEPDKGRSDNYWNNSEA